MKVAQPRKRSHTRQLKLVPEGPSESSPVRSAGLALRKGDPSRTGRSMVAYTCEFRCERLTVEPFYRPYRDGHLFLNHHPALRTGLLSHGPSGTAFDDKKYSHRSFTAFRSKPCRTFPL
jgi:hypothetical protein